VVTSATRLALSLVSVLLSNGRGRYVAHIRKRFTGAPLHSAVFFADTLHLVRVSLPDYFKDYPAADAGSAAIPLGAPEDAAGSDAGSYGPPPEDDSVASSEPEVSAPAPECPAVVQWRAEFAARLEASSKAERDGKAERATAAKEALTKMHYGWTSRCKDAEDVNQTREAELLRERDGVIARMSKTGEPPAWSVVPELVDMSGKFKEGARDTSRMRQVLMKLKTY
jgi:Clathrin light chain